MSNKKLDELTALLERSGNDSRRLDVLRRAQRFKRSWLELADALCGLRKSRAFHAWGYRDLHDYCAKELNIKGATVDKLVLSYASVQKHAPEVLERDGVARAIPSYESIDYFSRAIGERVDDETRIVTDRRLDAPADVVDQLRAAVFDDVAPITELRKRFNPVLNPQAPAEERKALLRRTKLAVKRLSELIFSVDELSQKRLDHVQTSLDLLNRDLDALLASDPAAKKSSSKKPMKRKRASRAKPAVKKTSRRKHASKKTARKKRP